MQRKLLVKLGQSFFILREYLEGKLTIHILSARSERHRSGVSILSLEGHLYDLIFMYLIS